MDSPAIDARHEKHEPHVDVLALNEFARVLAVGDAAAAVELALYRDARCYVQRYPELLAAFCEDNDIELCAWKALNAHWLDKGSGEKRVFACEEGALCWEFCADHQAAWHVKCATFRRCRDCNECLASPPLSPRASPQPPPTAPAPLRPRPLLPSPSPLPQIPLPPHHPPPPSPLPPAPILTKLDGASQHHHSHEGSGGSVLDIYLGETPASTAQETAIGHLDDATALPSSSMDPSISLTVVAISVALAVLLFFWWKRSTSRVALRQPRRSGKRSSGRRREDGKVPRSHQARLQKTSRTPKRGSARYERVALEAEPTSALG